MVNRGALRAIFAQITSAPGVTSWCQGRGCVYPRRGSQTTNNERIWEMNQPSDQYEFDVTKQAVWEKSISCCFLYFHQDNTRYVDRVVD
ncbi:hypothetical protein NDU88_000894 [Pleurodeles waltl]|uniref:Uncharacterized protein n=1 Tax=Pleurodeles waltl TaxID=8319 RepID=A0AAV7U4T9_PLEWA|nr:hypothetical protein NDU88_000894 [Pleurodeles waltl]